MLEASCIGRESTDGSIFSLTISKTGAKLSVRFGQMRGAKKMNGQRNGYRYYYVPLSAGRDGRAMGCREVFS
jgi:hypothetical protein